jgi:hypothetical protein
MSICARRTSACVVLGVAWLLLSRPALAQSADSSFADLVRKNGIIFVVDNNGSEFVGRLLRVDPSSLTMATSEGERSFAPERIIEIFRRGDSVANGAKIGAVIGAILGGLALKDGGCGALLDPYTPCSAGEYAGTMAITGGLGAGIGIGIDALFRGRTRIYPSKSGRDWPAVSVASAAGVHHASVLLSTRW